MKDTLRLGRDARKAEFTREHCKRLKQWFDPRGRFVGGSTLPDPRERLWNCFSLLDDGRPSSRRLAEAIIIRTPILSDYFQPVAAANLLLTYKGVFTPAAESYLLKILRTHMTNMLECSFCANSLNDLVAMGAFFTLAAGQLLDNYEFDHEFAAIPEVYSGDRLTCFGLNSLQSLAWRCEHLDADDEFNSPTYTPTTIQVIAKIVELIDNPEARALARQIEAFQWRELLALYHPELGVSCGPHSRAYRVDILNMSTQMRFLLCYTGLSRDRSLVDH